MFIGEQIWNHALKCADKTAVIYQDEKTTYKQLKEKLESYRSLLFGEAMLERWTEPLIVAIDVKRQDEQLYWFLAVTSLGWNGMLCHPLWSQSEREAMAKRANADVLLTDRSVIEEEQIPVWRVSTLSLSKQDATLPIASGSELFYTGFTSGSTGEPKAFRRTHLSWTRSFNDVEDVFKFNQSDRISVPGLLVHSLFLFASVHALHMGASVYLEQQFNVNRTRQTIEKYAVNVLYGVPTMLYALSQGELNARNVEKVIVSGAKWQRKNRAQVAAVFKEAQLYEFYGASELSFVSYVNHSDGDQQTSGGGKLFPSVRVDVRADGELFVSSPFLFSGYVGEEPIGSEFSVGDVGTIDETNTLYVTGRKGNMLIVGGHNVYPEETEDVVKELPFVEDAVAVGITDNYWGNQMVLYVQSSKAPVNAVSQIRLRTKEALSPLKRPRRIYVLDEFPLLPSGKVDRQTLAGVKK